MEEDFILTTGEGEHENRYFIQQVIRVNGKCYFSVINLLNFELMFGEYLGEVTEDDIENRLRVFEDFKNGCKNITYVDGYILDDLYEQWEGFM